MLMLTLADAGFEVLQAVDGQDGLDVLGKEQVDVVITDINMPRMDGYEVIRQMRSNSAHKATPILVLTTESEVGQEKPRASGRRDRLDGQAVRSGPIDRDHQQGRALRLRAAQGAMNMSSLDQLKQTFFDECSEALQQIELGLPDIRDGCRLGRHHQRRVPLGPFGQGRRRHFRLRRSRQIRPCLRDRAGRDAERQSWPRRRRSSIRSCRPMTC